MRGGQSNHHASSSSSLGNRRTNLGLSVGTNCEWRNLSPHERRLKNVYAALGISPTAKRPKADLWSEERRTGLFHDRISAKFPHPSFAIDKDGGVNHVDYFLAREVDKDHKGYLTNSEHNKAREMLHNGSYDELILNQSNQRNIIKAPGVIITKDDYYKPKQRYDHPKRKDPAHATLTELRDDRLAELREGGSAIFEKHLPKMIEESAVTTGVGGLNDHPQSEHTVKHIRDRARKDAAHIRMASGLTPEPTMINPDREAMSPGLDYIVSPTCRSRSELLQKRKEENIADIMRNRNEMEETFVCHSARRAAGLEEVYRKRAEDKPQKTLRSLKNDRKREAMEYEMAHAKKFESNRPYFSIHGDGQVPFWLASPENKTRTPSGMVHFQSEPDLSARRSSQRLSPAHVVSVARPKLPSKEWMEQRSEETTHHKRKGEPRKDDGPRLFDNLRPDTLTSEELLPRDRHSSFRLTREASYAQPNFQVRDDKHTFMESASSRSESPDRREGSIEVYSCDVTKSSPWKSSKKQHSTSGPPSPSLFASPKSLEKPYDRDDMMGRRLSKNTINSTESPMAMRRHSKGLSLKSSDDSHARTGDGATHSRRNTKSIASGVLHRHARPPTISRQELKTPEALGFVTGNGELTKIRSAGFFKPLEEMGVTDKSGKMRSPRKKK